MKLSCSPALFIDGLLGRRILCSITSLFTCSTLVFSCLCKQLKPFPSCSPSSEMSPNVRGYVDTMFRATSPQAAKFGFGQWACMAATTILTNSLLGPGRALSPVDVAWARAAGMRFQGIWKLLSQLDLMNDGMKGCSGRDSFEDNGVSVISLGVPSTWPRDSWWRWRDGGGH